MEHGGELLRWARKLKGLSQEEVAKQTSTTQANVSLKERGKRSITPEQIIKAVDLKVPPEEQTQEEIEVLIGTLLSDAAASKSIEKRSALLKAAGDVADRWSQKQQQIAAGRREVEHRERRRKYRQGNL